MSLPAQRQHHGPIRIRPVATLFPEPLPEDYTHLSNVSFNEKIFIRHPAYDDGDNMLLVLPAQDHADGGIHYGLVITACHIISNNQEGSLTASHTGSPVQADVDDVLCAGDYYYHVPPLSSESSIERAEPNRWAVVNSFLDWTFPSEMPSSWMRLLPFERAHSTVSQSALSALVKARDVSCRISSHETGVELAHLCPRNEIEWFLRNQMYCWNSVQGLDGDSLTNDSSNVLLLYADLHKPFDQRHFIFFPKCADSYVIHMLAPTPDFGQLYHKARLAPIPQCNPHFVYTRFAWAILPLLSGFLSKPGTRRVVRVDDKGNAVIEDDSQASKRRERAAEARRDQSPEKRPRTAIPTSINEVVYNEVECDGAVKADAEANPPLRKRRRIDSNEALNPSPPPSRYSASHYSTESTKSKPFSLDLGQEQYGPPYEPPSWYHGWEKADRLRKQWIREHPHVRPEGYVPTPPGRLDESADVKDQLKALGVEILEDDDD